LFSPYFVSLLCVSMVNLNLHNKLVKHIYHKYVPRNLIKLLPIKLSLKDMLAQLWQPCKGVTVNLIHEKKLSGYLHPGSSSLYNCRDLFICSNLFLDSLVSCISWNFRGLDNPSTIKELCFIWVLISAFMLIENENKCGVVLLLNKYLICKITNYSLKHVDIEIIGFIKAVLGEILGIYYDIRLIYLFSPGVL